MDKTTRALLYLMRCALQNEKPQAIDGLDYDALYQLSVSHSVVAMIAMALESGELLTEEYVSAACAKKWKDIKVNAIRKSILVDAEWEQISCHFEQEGIWYMPLKGAILKDMYPKMGMRQMADIDVLFDSAYQHQVKAYMENRGYVATSFGKGNHDVYEKPPMYNFEFHRELFNKFLYAEASMYYQNVETKRIKDEGNGYGYHFTDEDFYVYILAHGYKHYSNNGTGIRFLSDIYVFLQQKKATLNWDHIASELRDLKIYEFEAATRELADKLFGAEHYDLAKEEGKLLGYLMGAGIYGSTKNGINRKLREIQQDDAPVTIWTKIRYTWKRLFPDRAFMELYAPFCKKHKWSIPFFWIYRIIKAVIFKRKIISREIRIMKK